MNLELPADGTLLLLLSSARVFQERCRMYIYRATHLRAKTSDELRQRCVALNYLLATSNTGRFVLSLHYELIPSNPPNITIPPEMSALALLVPNLREFQLEGGPFVFHEDIDWSLLIPNPTSITKIMLEGWHCMQGLVRLMRTCPSLASLALASAHVTSDTVAPTADPEPTNHSHSATAACSIGQLTLADCDKHFLQLISGVHFAWSGLCRLILVDYVHYYHGSLQFVTRKAVTSFRENGKLEFLYLGPMNRCVTESTVVDILQIPHVALQFWGKKSAKAWVLSILTYAQKRNRRLVNLDVIFEFLEWDELMHRTNIYQELYAQLMSLNERNDKQLRVRFITTGTPIRHPDNARKESRQCTQPVQLILTDTSSHRIHREFMDGDISGSCYGLACPNSKIQNVILPVRCLQRVSLEQRLSTLI